MFSTKACTYRIFKNLVCQHANRVNIILVNHQHQRSAGVACFKIQTHTSGEVFDHFMQFGNRLSYKMIRFLRLHSENGVIFFNDLTSSRHDNLTMMWTAVFSLICVAAPAAHLFASSHKWCFVAPSIYFITRAPDILGSALIFGES